MKGIQGRVFVRALSLVLAFVLVFSYVPMKPVFAEGIVEETEAPVEAAAVDAEDAGDENAVETGTANEVANENENEAAETEGVRSTVIADGGTGNNGISLHDYISFEITGISGEGIEGNLGENLKLISGNEYTLSFVMKPVEYELGQETGMCFTKAKVEQRIGKEDTEILAENNDLDMGRRFRWKYEVYGSWEGTVNFTAGEPGERSIALKGSAMRKMTKKWHYDTKNVTYTSVSPEPTEPEQQEYTKDVHFYFLKDEYSGVHSFSPENYWPNSSDPEDVRIKGSMTTSLHNLSELKQKQHYYDKEDAPDGTEDAYCKDNFISGATYTLEGETFRKEDNATDAFRKALKNQLLTFGKVELTAEQLEFTPFSYSLQGDVMHVDVMLQRAKAAPITVHYYFDEEEDKDREATINDLVGEVVEIPLLKDVSEEYELVKVVHGDDVLNPSEDGKYAVTMTDTESDVRVYYQKKTYEVNASYYLAKGSELEKERDNDYYSLLFKGAIKSANDLKGNEVDIYFPNDVYDGYTFLDANKNEVTNETLTAYIKEFISKGNKIEYDGEKIDLAAKEVKAVIHRITKDHGRNDETNLHVDIRLEITEKDVNPEPPVDPDDDSGNTSDNNGDNNGGEDDSNNSGGNSNGGDNNSGGDNTGGGGSTGGGTNTDADEDNTVTIDDEDTPLGGVENGDDAAADSDADVNSDSADVVVDLDDEDTPLGGAELPYTAQHTDTFYYAIGAVLAALGLLIRRMTK